MPSKNINRLSADAFDLLRFWKTARGSQTLPNIRHFKPTNLRPWIGKISKIEVREGEKRFYVRLHGTETAETVGKNYAGAYLEDCVPQPDLALQPFHESIQKCAPMFSVRVPGPSSDALLAFERVILPFTNVPEDDETSPVSVDWFMVWEAPQQLHALQRSLISDGLSQCHSDQTAIEDEFEMMVINVNDSI